MVAATGTYLFFLRRFLHSYAVKRICYPPRLLADETPSNWQMPYQEVFLQTRDNLKLHGWFIPVENSKATIIMGHGYGGSKAPDLRHAAWLCKGGYNVLMFDFRGHGYSDGPEGTSLGYVERLDMHAAVDFLLNRGERRIGVMGFSMGASVAIIAAAENPHIGAVLADSPYAELWRSISTEVNRLYRAPGIFAAWSAKYAFWEMGVHHRFKVSIADPTSFVRRISPRPLFLIHGELDALTPVENSKILYKLAKEPKELWIEPGAGHVMVYEQKPEEYMTRVLSFFDRVDWQARTREAIPERWTEEFTANGITTLDGRFTVTGRSEQ